MVEKLYQVFVSSTYADLKDQRRYVSNTLAKAGYIPSGMELFPATDLQQLEFIKRVIDRCDYYVVIVGGRYGSLDDDNVSFTEREYEYALEIGIPVLAFLHASPEEIPVGKTDQDTAKAIKLKSFRDRLSTGRLIDTWADSQELCTKVVIAITQATNLSPGKGWVRGDQAIDPKLLQELERLRLENAKLREQLQSQLGDQIVFPSHLLGPDGSVRIPLEVQYSTSEETKDGRHAIRSEIIEIEIELGDLFDRLFDKILTEPSERTLQEVIGHILLSRVTQIEKNNGAHISSDEVTQLRSHYEALGLIESAGRTSIHTGLGGMNFNSHHIVWTVTSKGRRYVSQRRAIRKQA